ncbi:MAG: DUF1800 family protein [Gemmatimonadaceae bacterium]|nr:DUF1800 family protein [Chitinophagaceae bacterium]
MGDQKVSRRKFLQPFPAVQEDQGTGTSDPLFDKYARKSLAPRHYSSEEIVHQIGEAEGISPMVRVGNVTSGLNPYSGPWTAWEVHHLLRHTNFGSNKTWLDQLLPLTPSAAVDIVLNINNTPPAPPVNWYQNFFADENGLAYGADWTTNHFPTTAVGQTSNTYRMQSLRRWLFGLTLNGDITIREKMVWFWYHFIPIDFESIFQSSNQYINTNSARIFYRYVKLFRDSAGGNFRTLIRAVATEPSMMFYLNNQANSASSPDENFARELMELFTLGKDPGSQYTQDDVIAAAKVVTGWRVQGLNTANPATNFVASAHSTATKQFSSFFNNKVINYQSGVNGANELDELLNMIFAKDVVVSQYICRRLYRYFVYYDIDSNIEANVIVPLAQTFVANNWNIMPVLQQLFKSEHFFDMANRGVYIKSPFDLVAGLLNTFNLNTTGTSIENQYRVWSYYNDTICLGIDQQMGSMPNVAGWNAYYQTPAYHEYWINSNAVQKRFKFIQDHFNGVTVNGKAIKIDTIAYAQSYGPTIVEDPDQLVATAIKYLLPIDLSTGQKDQIKSSSLLGGQVQNHYWTNAWNAYLANPANTTNKNIVETRLKALFSGLCQLAEYQLN